MADANLTFLHPHISSKISSEEITFPASEGISSIFVADVFEKGVDNKVQLVTSVEEFQSKFGLPNYTKYGQAAYAIQKWLETSGNNAYVMRVLPKDAVLAHVILNIQTKKVINGKKIKDSNGNLRDFNDVYLRPIITYSTLNNTSEEMLISEIEKDRDSNENTIDGYENNFLFIAYPYGRGSSYNDLGIRISLNQSFDSQTDSRVYNFEVIRFGSNLEVSVIEGPFFVSFDPDALSSSNYSMFIEDVVNRYSNYIKIKFNVDNYLKIANLINPDVNPATIDILSGISKLDINGDREKFYSSITGTYLDVHTSLHKYNSLGEPFIVSGEYQLNISDHSNVIENAIITLDNNHRESLYNDMREKLDFMKENFQKLGTNEFTNHLNSIFDATNGRLKIFIDDLYTDEIDDSTLDKVLKAKENYATTPTEENFNKLRAAVNEYEIRTNDFLKLTSEIDSLYSLIVSSEESTVEAYLNFLSKRDSIKNSLLLKNQLGIFTLNHKNNLMDISSDLLQVKLGNYSGELVDNLEGILSSLYNEIEYTYLNIIPSVYGSYENAEDNDVDVDTFTDRNDDESIIYRYEESVKIIKYIRAGYIDIGDINDSSNNVGYIFSSVGAIIDELDDVIKNAIVYFNTNFITDEDIGLKTDINAISILANTIKSNILSNIENVDTDELLEVAAFNIESNSLTLISFNSKVFNNNLHDFSSPIKLSLGSDGSFEYNPSNVKVRNNLIKNELIKAYKGEIDNTILNKDLIEFDFIFDNNYPLEVKNAIVTLARDIRQDFFFFSDVNITASPQDALDFRKNKYTVDSRYVGIYTQDVTVYDEYTSKHIHFTIPYLLAKKIPFIRENYGLQFPLAGSRRGTIDGVEGLSWYPDSNYKEFLYASKLNYIEKDSRGMRLGSQLTSEYKTSPLSEINNVLTLLKIKRNSEKIVKDFQFELNILETQSALTYTLNNYLSTYISDRSCENIDVNVSASDYDKQQKILRVSITIKFFNSIERIVISFDVTK